MNNQRKQLLLDEIDVKYILEQNRDYIGHRFLFGFDSFIASIGFLVTISLSDFKGYNWLKYPLGIIGIIYLVWGIYNLSIYYKNKNFDKDTLYMQLEDINLMEKHEHSIILIKLKMNLIKIRIDFLSIRVLGGIANYLLIFILKETIMKTSKISRSTLKQN